MTIEIIKSGWLQRRTTILKNWKREWFVLTDDARLLRMKSPKRLFAKADDVFYINQWREIRIGSEQVLSNVEPPNGSKRDYLMSLVPNEGDTWDLCAESLDDLLAWQISLEDTRQEYIKLIKKAHAQLTNEQIPLGRDNLPPNYQEIFDSHYPHKIYQAPDGSTHTIVYVNQDSYSDRGSNTIPDVLKETAITTFKLGPLYMVPFFPAMWW